MKFIFGVIVGTAVGPRMYKLVDKHYGHIIIPYLKAAIEKIDAWEPPKEES